MNHINYAEKSNTQRVSKHGFELRHWMYAREYVAPVSGKN